MRRALPAVLVSLAAPALSGCFIELLTTTAIQGELAAENAKAAQRQLGYARDSMAETQISRAIRMYQAEFGQYPPTLNALVPGHLPAVPLNVEGSPYYYDSFNGSFSPRPPEGVFSLSQADQQSMRTLDQAIELFAQRNRQFPPSLETLVAYNFLRAIPATESGKAFVYDPRTGGIQHPDGNSGYTPRNAPRGNGVRQNLGGATSGYGQRQLDALDDLDL